MTQRGGFYWNRHRPRYNLIIRNEAGEELQCDAHWGGNGHTMLSFADRNTVLNAFGNGMFDSERQAWYFWYQFKKEYPDRVEGWTPEVTMYEP